MSFLYDPALLVGVGAVGGAALDDELEDVATVGTMLVFWGVSVPLWFDSPRVAWLARFWGAESGRAFMLNSGRIGFGLLRFDPARNNWRRHVVAALILLTYPLWFRLGWAIGRSLRRRPPAMEAAVADAGDSTPRERDDAVAPPHVSADV
ncbi:MAG: hypothetical protein IT198_02630 [Acidimicrobiia bacterium]|nr:hypothetical protein [Acidimicrobiia bacterium]